MYSSGTPLTPQSDYHLTLTVTGDYTASILRKGSLIKVMPKTSLGLLGRPARISLVKRYQTKQP